MDGGERYAATTRTEALDLVALGVAVCEVAAPLPDGSCSCRDRGECRAAGKHPIGRAWLKRAIRERSNPRAVATRLRLVPLTSYGLVPPPESGLMIIDRDDPSVLLPMPETFEVHRASADPNRGHYYFKLATGIGEDEVPRAFAGGEIRIAGSGHVVGPGCRHASGDLYESNGAAVAYATRDLIDALSALKPVRRGSDGAVEAVLGSRHDWLTRQARKYRGFGWDSDRIHEALLEDNETKCIPPLEGRDLTDIGRMVDWAMRSIAPDRGVTVRRVSRSERKTWSRS
jgi:putative DNA primase/helicase